MSVNVTANIALWMLWNQCFEISPLEMELFYSRVLNSPKQTIQYICFLPCKDPMALWTHLHTCSSSSTLSIGECVLCIRTSFFFTLSTPRLSGTPVRTPSRSMAVSPFKWSMFWVRRWLEPSSLCNATSALSRWDLRGLSTQENMARSSARSVDRGRGSLIGGLRLAWIFYVQLWHIFGNRIACVFIHLIIENCYVAFIKAFLNFLFFCMHKT